MPNLLSSPDTNPQNSHLSIRLGVTGHRDPHPDCEERVRSDIRKSLKNLQQQLGDVPLTIVSGLASGADQWVAEEALEAGMRVEALLPMPKDVYAKDFDEEGWQRLEQILSHENTQALTLPSIEPESGDIDRDSQYALLAESLCKGCHFLLALWDGNLTELTGGTADTIRRFLQEGEGGLHDTLELIEASGEDTAEAVLWIPTARISNTGEISTVTPTWLTGGLGGQLLGRSNEIPEGTRRYISSICTHHSALNAQLQNDGNSPQASLRQKARDGLDIMAMEQQRHSDALFKLFALMAASMGTVFLLYAKILATPWFLIVYLALFAGGWLMFRRAKRYFWFQRYLLYRACAEILRTEVAVIEGGLDAVVDTQRALHRIGVNQMEGFRWAQALIVSLTPMTGNNHRDENKNGSASPAPATCLKWVDEQISYFDRKKHQLHHKHHRLHKIRVAVLLFLIVGILTLIGFKKPLSAIEFGAKKPAHTELVQADTSSDDDGDYAETKSKDYGKTAYSSKSSVSAKTVLVLLLEILPFWLGIWELYQNKLATRELAWQYRHQRRHFHRARIRLSRSAAPSAHQRTLSELGEQSLMETCLWCIQRYHRELEPPTAG